MGQSASHDSAEHEFATNTNQDAIVLRSEMHDGRPHVLGAGTPATVEDLHRMLAEGIRPDVSNVPLRATTDAAPESAPELEHVYTAKHFFNIRRNSIRWIADTATDTWQLDFEFDADQAGSMFILVDSRLPEVPLGMQRALFARYCFHPDATERVGHAFEAGLNQQFRSVAPGSHGQLTALQACVRDRAASADLTFVIIALKRDSSIHEYLTAHPFPFQPLIAGQPPAQTNVGVIEASSVFVDLPRDRITASGDPAAVAASPSSTGADRDGVSVRLGTHLIDAHQRVMEVKEIYGIDAGPEAMEGSEAPASGADEDVRGGTPCVICMAAVRDTVVLPCRHMCLCHGCAHTLRSQTTKCPICRTEIEALVLIRLDASFDGAV